MARKILACILQAGAFLWYGKKEGRRDNSLPRCMLTQAWSVAAVFLLLKAILQLKISPARKEVSFYKPILPSYLESVGVRNLPISDRYVDLEITRHGRDNMLGINWNNSSEEWKLIVIK